MKHSAQIKIIQSVAVGASSLVFYASGPMTCLGSGGCMVAEFV